MGRLLSFFTIVRRAPIPPPFTRERNRPEPPRKQNTDGTRINADIIAREIRVIGEDGEQLGVMAPREALVLADEAGLDLVEISPTAVPPVCKILDYGKYRYEQQKKEAEARKKQKTIDIKEIKLRPAIGDHDFEIKMRNAREFLADGDKVKITMRFRGREQQHQHLAYAVLNKVKEQLGDVMKIEQEPKFEGRQITMVMAAK